MPACMGTVHKGVARSFHTYPKEGYKAGVSSEDLWAWTSCLQMGAGHLATTSFFMEEVR